jgi:hypothetical protein
LAHGCDLDVEVVVREKKIRSEVMVGAPVSIPADGKCPRLVKPGNAIKVQKECELPLTVVGKTEAAGTGRLEWV